ncbi:spore coat protein GerQ [Oceanobacillus piezotolerans]|uniref:Spore coat protein GerQ n=1 Tax=Oceanobacillus piezotolerans TaxID=2448030 RepID=A0A498D967_9BACI|nr:spore coat protein GerQ [Oceanobacillus piezotolerans]RLL42846.1 spore coat protein GerQ [Oceanobacillus piezotolerans]
MTENNTNANYGAYPYYYYPQAYYPAYTRTMPPQSFGQGQQTQQQGSDVPGMLPLQQSYIENILRLNKGKLATFYMTFEGNREYNSRQFTGIIEAAGRDHIIISEPETGRRYLLLMVYLDFVEFGEEINYLYPGSAGTAQQQMVSFPPR